MKKVILTSVAATALMVSSAASAQQAEQEATSFISEQVANVSVELFNATKATVIETLTVWGDELLASESDQAVAANEPAEEKQNQSKTQ
ncbi:MAG: hypothetical protein CMF19_06220 [Idiomarinaceae bacterium]|nr:hypothetical protein [Idiomarinaceae bacterium]